MLVFIDESGDPGFQVEKGSSPIFVAAMVVFASGEDAQATEPVIRAAMERLIALEGSGRGLWGPDSTRMVRELREERSR